MSEPQDFTRVKSLPKLPPRRPESHKGDYGRVLVVAGSRGMAGAAALAGVSALRSGAGLVRVATAHEVQPTVAGFEPSYMTWPLHNDPSGRIDFNSATRTTLEGWRTQTDVVAIGPGLGQSASLGRMVRWFLKTWSIPVVVDADALNMLAAEDRAAFQMRDAPTIVTPHPGEMARLLETTTTEIQSHRTESALACARRWEQRVVVVLKGHGTIVTDGVQLFVNKTGNPGMATGGSGDCLTGVIAALTAQGLSPFDAAVLGVHIHGLAGDIARDQNGMVGLIAGDLVDALADAFALYVQDT